MYLLKAFVFVTTLALGACGNAEEPASANSQEGAEGALSANISIEEPAIEQLEANLRKTFGDLTITSAQETPIKDVMEIVINGAERAYASRDGHYLITGEMYAVGSNGAVSVTEKRLKGVRSEGIAHLDEATLVRYPGAEPQRREIFVFTDVSCGYCQKLHADVPELNKQGITVSYLAFPRGGMESGAARKMAAVWCAADRNQALTEEKLAGGMKAAPIECDSPVGDHYLLGLAFGVRGTPAVFLPDGTQVGGYLSPKKMLQALQLPPR